MRNNHTQQNRAREWAETHEVGQANGEYYRQLRAENARRAAAA